MENLHLLSGNNLISGISLLGLILLGIFRPERVSSWVVFRIAWMVVIMSFIVPFLISLTYLTSGASVKSQGIVMLSYCVGPILSALGSILTLSAMKLHSS